MPLPRAQGGLRTAAVFSLCALFAILAMGLTLLASGAYRGTTADADRNYTHRTAMSYLINQIRRCDELGGVTVGTFGSSEALTLYESVDDATYVTLLYCYEGELRELYMEEGTGLTPEDGTAILPLQALDFTQEGGRLTITIADEGAAPYTASISPRSGVEGGRP